MKKILPLTAAAVLIGSVTPAAAQSSRIYFAGYLGLSMNENSDFTDRATPSTGSLEPDDHNANFAGALGFRFNRNFRLETELSYRKSEFDSANITGTGITPLSGEVSSTMLMLNSYYDFDLKGWKLQPYVTAGVGVGYHSGELSDPGAFTANYDDNDFGFVWNAGAGMKYRTRDNFAWTAGYRYLDGSEIELGQTDLDLSSHEIRIGLEWDLGY